MAKKYFGSEFRSKEVIEVDLHGLHLWEAQHQMEKLMALINPEEVREIVVIHGHRRGKSILRYIREEFQNDKIDRKFLALNQGITSLILKQ